MSSKSAYFLGLALLSAAIACAAPAAKPKSAKSDIVPPDQRRASVELAEKLAHPAPLEPVPEDIPQPFSPPGFEKPDGSANPDRGGAADPKAPVMPQTDRDVLAAVAAKIPTTGTILLGGKPLLISGTNRIEVGSHFTVVYNGQEYELELTAIDRTTFTVRYKGEEFTRPIKLAKTP